MNEDHIDNLGPRSVEMVERGPAVDPLAMIPQTGGTYSKIDSAEAQETFVNLVISNGPTNIDNAGGAGTEILPGPTIAKLIWPSAICLSGQSGREPQFYHHVYEQSSSKLHSP
jgi:hypothetical protein